MDSLGLTVNVVTKNNTLQATLQHNQQKPAEWKIFFSKKPLVQGAIDAYVIPEGVFLSSETMERLIRSAVIIGYGNLDLLDAAFCSGCDDYLKEPWPPSELYTRLTRFSSAFRFTRGGTSITLVGRRLCTETSTALLTFHETLVLRTLLKNRGTVVPRTILNYILKGNNTAVGRSIDMHISSIRKKIHGLVPVQGERSPILAVRGIGYMMELQTEHEKHVDKVVDNSNTTL